MEVLKSSSCKQCIFKQLEVVSFAKDVVIKSCNKCNTG
jgi:hypothetical protein